MGRTSLRQIDCGIRVYDKLVVVCSERSLQSDAVLSEIERALQRDDKEGRHILFPIRIDNCVLSEKWQRERKADVIDKVMATLPDRTRTCRSTKRSLAS